MYKFNGVELTGEQWAKKLGISRARFHQRLQKYGLTKQTFAKRNEYLNTGNKVGYNHPKLVQQRKIEEQKLLKKIKELRKKHSKK